MYVPDVHDRLGGRVERSMASLDKKELWVDWTRDALDKYETPDQIDNADDLADDMADLATKYADSMLDEYEARFESRNGDRRRKRKVDRDEGKD